MKNVLRSKLLFVLVLCIVYSCSKKNKKISTLNKNSDIFYEVIDTLILKDNYLFTEILYKKNNLDYVMEFNKKKHKIPFNFIVGKDTLQADGFDATKINSNDSQFRITFNVGNATTIIYYFEISNAFEIFLSKIIIKYQVTDGKEQINNILIIDKNIDQLDKNELTKINTFINEN